MLSKFFNRDKKIRGKIKLFTDANTVVFEGTVQQLSEELKTLHDLSDDHLNLLEANSRLEAENSRLGNAMFDIINQETSGANATVKRMVAIAKSAVLS